MVLQTGVGLNSYFIPYICILIDLFHSILICDVTKITLITVLSTLIHYTLTVKH